MKYVFLLVLLLVGRRGQRARLERRVSLVHNMTESPRIMPGERGLQHAAGQRARDGGELRLPKEEREAAALRRNPIPADAGARSRRAASSSSSTARRATARRARGTGR